MTASGPGCVKTPTARVFGSCKMSPEVPIVDCGPFCAVGFSRTIDKSEFSHSLGRFATVGRRLWLPSTKKEPVLDRGMDCQMKTGEQMSDYDYDSRFVCAE